MSQLHIGLNRWVWVSQFRLDIMMGLGVPTPCRYNDGSQLHVAIMIMGLGVTTPHTYDHGAGCYNSTVVDDFHGENTAAWCWAVVAASFWCRSIVSASFPCESPCRNREFVSAAVGFDLRLSFTVLITEIVSAAVGFDLRLSFTVLITVFLSLEMLECKEWHVMRVSFEMKTSKCLTIAVFCLFPSALNLCLQ